MDSIKLVSFDWNLCEIFYQQPEISSCFSWTKAVSLIPKICNKQQQHIRLNPTIQITNISNQVFKYIRFCFIPFVVLQLFAKLLRRNNGKTPMAKRNHIVGNIADLCKFNWNRNFEWTSEKERENGRVYVCTDCKEYSLSVYFQFVHLCVCVWQSLTIDCCRFTKLSFGNCCKTL